jgi:hypothetical protein
MSVCLLLISCAACAESSDESGHDNQPSGGADDDNVDDDNDDDNNDDDDNDTAVDDDASPEWDPDHLISIELVDGGGSFTADRVSIAFGAADDLVIAGQADRTLRLYRWDARGWTEEVVAPIASAPALALGPLWIPVISYWNPYHRDLMFATKVDGGWKNEIVDEGDIDGFSAIGVWQTIVHIVYYDAALRAVRHAANAGDGWTLETIEDEIASGARPALAVDTGGGLHVCYANGAFASLRVAANAGGAWAVEVLESVVSEGRCGLALDSNGATHVLHTDHARIFYSNNVSGEWETTTIYYPTGAATAPRNVVLAIDGSDRLHGAFTEKHNQGTWWERSPMYFSAVGGQWTPPVEAGVEFELRPEIAAQGDGDAAITGSRFGYLIVNRLAGGEWTNRVMLPGASCGWSASAVADDNGQLHVAYPWSGAPDFVPRVVYAQRQDDAWVRELATPPGLYVSDVSLAFDPAGQAHLAVMGDAVLYHATNIGGSWEMSPVDPDIGFEATGAIATDEAGAVHIAYGSWSDREMRYATNASGEWEIETLAEANAVPQHGRAISVGRDGVVRLLYRRLAYDVGRLIYAENSTGAWRQEAVTPDIDAGNAEMALDHEDVPHAAFVSLANNHVLYARRPQDEWLIEDTGLLSIDGLSLALDALSGEPRLAYAADLGLRYAVRDAGRWLSTMIDPLGIETDPEGTPPWVREDLPSPPGKWFSEAWSVNLFVAAEEINVVYATGDAIWRASFPAKPSAR